MRLRVIFCIFLFSSTVVARTSRTAARHVDPSYSTALATANRFLQAWQTQDHETGIVMLTDAARQQTSRDKLQEFFSPSANAAFEIQHGKRMNSREYIFPVVLFGVSGLSLTARESRLVVIRTKHDWTVDRLP